MLKACDNAIQLREEYCAARVNSTLFHTNAVAAKTVNKRLTDFRKWITTGTNVRKSNNELIKK